MLCSSLSGDNDDNDDDGDNNADAENASIVSSHTLTNVAHAEGTNNADTLKPAAKVRPHQRRHLPVVARHSTATTMAIVTDNDDDDDDGMLSDAEPVSPNTLGSRSPDDADESSPTSSCSPPSPPHRNRSTGNLPAAAMAKTRLLSLPTTTASAAAAATKTQVDRSTASASAAAASASTTDADTAASEASPAASRKWLRDKHRMAGTMTRGVPSSVVAQQRHSDASAATTASAAAAAASDTQSISGGGRSRKLSIGSAVRMCRDGHGSSTASMAMLGGSANLTDSEAGSSMLRTRRLKKLHVSVGVGWMEYVIMERFGGYITLS